MNKVRIAAALNELAAAILDGEGAGSPPSLPAPAAAFANAQPPAAPAGDPGVCPIHETPWRTTKKDGTPAKRAFCSQKDADGNYCNEKGPWQ